ncbi:MAG: chromate efflux transporter [Thiotrichales bacterium]|nr:chromate efflux transporter [Thiotrichales bacterium]
MWAIFWRFFVLGWLSFGGPAAHLGYFRHTFVEKLGWVDEAHYSRLIALSQFLPGPGSSQVGFAIGLARGGQWGAWAAFVGFTLPSFGLLLAAALIQPPADQPFFSAVIAGLKLLAVVVVADAVWGMAQNFCKTRLTQGVMLLTAVLLWLMPSMWLQLGLLLAAFALGWRFVQVTPPPTQAASTVFTSAGWVKWALLGAALLVMVHLLWQESLPSALVLFAQFLQAGALVFGGGHVVLPLLQPLVGAQVGSEVFLSGYALSQAVPGPMFTFATYLGAHLLPTAPFTGALLASLGIFLPGLLLMLWFLSSSSTLMQNAKVQGGMRLLNAAVVGLLLATLISPVAGSALHSLWDGILVLVALAVLRHFKLHILWLVLAFGLLLPLIRLGF